MKVVLAGGSGQVGTLLARWFSAKGDEVVILSRNSEPAQWRTVAWDAKSQGDWVGEIEGADIVINLAGRSVNCRYNPENRKLIMASRVDSTRALGEAISMAKNPPSVWLQSSTATIYAHRFDAANDEASGIIGGEEEAVPDTWKFSIDVAKAWEEAAEDFDLPRTRLVLLRSAMIMSPDPGGIFDTLRGLVKKGLGGRAASGRQYVSWIHAEDFLRAIDWIVSDEKFSGPVNLASPNPLPQAEFMKALREAAGVKIGLPATRWMLELGAVFMRTETELILKSRRVTPGKLLRSGFVFRRPDWPEAAAELCDN